MQSADRICCGQVMIHVDSFFKWMCMQCGNLINCVRCDKAYGRQVKEAEERWRLKEAR